MSVSKICQWFLARVALVFAALFISTASIAAGLEEVIMLFARCELDGVIYVAKEKQAEAKLAGIATNPYLLERKKLAEIGGVARFELDDTYAGLRAMYLDVPVYAPRDDNQVWRLYFDATYKNVSDKLGEAMSIRFRKQPTETEEYKRGEAPTLLMDLRNKRPFIACNKTEKGN